MTTHQTLRERIELQHARNAPMYERLRRAQIERDAEGLRDMKALGFDANRDAETAGGIIGWLAVTLFAAMLGAGVALWWSGADMYQITAALECAK